VETGKFNRRQFLKFTSAAFAGLVITPTVYLAINNELNEPVVKRVLLPVRNLPAAFEGFRLVALADFHLYPYTQPELVRKSIALANSLKPDLGVFLGDYVWRNLDAIYELAPLLAGLDAKHGIFGIIGYHDIWLNRQVVESALHQAGIPMLVNQGISIAQGSGVINLVGLDDGWSGRPDLDAARQGLQKEAPTILLMHEPDLADTYSQDRYISLQLSGHTRGTGAHQWQTVHLAVPGPEIRSWAIPGQSDVAVYQSRDRRDQFSSALQLPSGSDRDYPHCKYCLKWSRAMRLVLPGRFTSKQIALSNTR